ncbi:hypothetical protein BGZ65_006434 [Modicella reniformis]|uniref:Uncharacterized protein n=1 Tax=Modicella reniformis TaxID=1440133 RepID=A0A9P6ML33_9FUNG|nr:hypothetical protein BGZ65_006434 [Modicella reniformis]
MSTASFLTWALNKVPKKEHVTFTNFVKKFGFTTKESANEAYITLINSTNICQRRQMKLHESYKLFLERQEDGFWADRTLKTTDHMLLVNSAVIAKKAGTMIQEAGLLEANSGLGRYLSDLKTEDESLEVLDDTDDSESEATETGGTVPRGSVITACVFAVLVNILVRIKLIPPKFRPYWINFNAVGLGLINPSPALAITMLTGWIGDQIWMRFNRVANERYMYAIAGGFISGVGVAHQSDHGSWWYQGWFGSMGV